MIYHETDSGIIHQGEVLDILRTLPAESVNCCVTSPPYWGLRDYGTASWEGGDAGCSHQRDSKVSASGETGSDNVIGSIGDGIYKVICRKCGAIRKDQQLGLEKTPEEYVSRMVEIFREVRRVLRPDGTLWLNLGDSYAGSGGPGSQYDNKQGSGHKGAFQKYDNPNRKSGGLKPKDLVGIPWRVAFALQADGCADYRAVQTIQQAQNEICDAYRGEIMPDKVINVLDRLDKEYREAKGTSWYLRQDIIWHKPNPMPESVTDRCTKSHEYVFLMSKSAKYYYDHEAIKELANYDGRKDEVMKGSDKYANGFVPNTSPKSIAVVGHERWAHKDEEGNRLRNKRSVWTVTTKPFREAHFATFPRDLIRPMIQAGCPKQVCIKCGKARERITESIQNQPTENYTGQSTKDYDKAKAQNPSDTKRRILESMSRKTIVTGFTDCGCNAGFEPGVVLDPFMGSGTTAIEAIYQNKRYIGIDLNPDYCEIAKRRIETELDQTTIDLEEK